ncbi:unnamed protein product [Linum trigynum]|uniref:Uncharacterized protein n=1 Tax=Linum trigynum TaxID=586398 RepID=A0AAV2E7B4_9ROSI
MRVTELMRRQLMVGPVRLWLAIVRRSLYQGRNMERHPQLRLPQVHVVHLILFVSHAVLLLGIAAYPAVNLLFLHS